MLGKLMYASLGYESDSINLILEASKKLSDLKLDVLGNKELIEKQEDIIKEAKANITKESEQPHPKG